MITKIKEFIGELLSAMKTTLFKLVDSKKASAFVASLTLMTVVYVFGPLPDELKKDFAEKIMAVVMVYMGAQGAADFGKEAKKEEKPKTE